MPKIRMKRSAIWQHFSIEYQENGSNAIVKCNRCNATVPYCKNTTNLWSHIRTHHRNALEIILSSPNQFTKRYGADDYSVPRSSSSHALMIASNRPNSEYTLPSSSKVFEKVRKCPSDLKRAEEITRSLTRMIIEDVLSFSIVDSRTFANFVKTLDEKYVLPDKDILISKYLSELYINRCIEIEENLSKAANVNLSIDLWTDNKGKASFLVVIAHFCVDGAQHRNVLQLLYLRATCTAENLRESLIKITETWKIGSKIKTVVDDGSSSVKAALNATTWRRISCFGRALNFVAQSAVENSGTVINAIHKCRDIVRVFETNNTAAKLLKRYQARRNSSRLTNLTKDVADRWTSTYSMLKRVNDSKPILLKVFAEMPQKDVPCVTQDEWGIIFEAIRVLKPLHEAAKELLGDRYATVSKIIPIVHGIEAALKAMDDLSLDAALLRDNLLSEMDKRIENIKVNSVYLIATFLDPRYKGVAFHSKEDVKLARNQLINDLNRLDGEDTGCDACIVDGSKVDNENAETDDILWAAFDKKVQELTGADNCYTNCSLNHELERYANSRVTNRKTDPITWWNTEGSVLFPKMTKFALDYLCVPAMSVSNEILFLKIRKILSDRRIRLQSKYVNMLAVIISSQYK